MLKTALRSICCLFLLANLVAGGLYTPENLPGLPERDDVRERSWTESEKDDPESRDRIQFPVAANKTIFSLSAASSYGGVRKIAEALIIQLPLHDAPRGPPARI